MYCPVDGIEWREGITRCPEHDVELVDEPPEIEEDEPLLAGLNSDAAMRVGVRIVGFAAVFYAASGVLMAGWFSLAQQRQWTETGVLHALQFAHDASTKVALATLGLIVAAILGRAFTRLGLPATRPVEPLEDAEEPLTSGAEGWIVTLLTSFVVVFAFVWAASGVAVGWQEVKLGTTFGRFPMPSSQTYVNLAALHNAAYACALAALASLGALLMARAYDRLTGIR